MRYFRNGRSLTWGAWIETSRFQRSALVKYVAPSRGERGLKLLYINTITRNNMVAPSRWER